MDLEYRDRRLADYNKEFADEQRNIEPKKLTREITINRSDGEYKHEQLDIRSLIIQLEQMDRDIRQLKQDNKMLAGQLELSLIHI